MAAREYHLEIDAVDATLVSIEKVLDLPKLRKQADELEVEAGVPNLWDDPEAVQKDHKQFISRSICYCQAFGVAPTR